MNARECLWAWRSYLQLGKYLFNVPVAALRNVHVLLVGAALEHRLGSVGEVLVEGEERRHGLHLRLHLRLRTLFGLHFAQVLFPPGDHLQKNMRRMLRAIMYS